MRRSLSLIKLGCPLSVVDCMRLLAELCGLFCICALAFPSSPANAQADTRPPAAGEEQAASAPSVIAEICPTLEQAAAKNGLPVVFLSA